MGGVGRRDITTAYNFCKVHVSIDKVSDPVRNYFKVTGIRKYWEM